MPQLRKRDERGCSVQVEGYWPHYAGYRTDAAIGSALESITGAPTGSVRMSDEEDRNRRHAGFCREQAILLRGPESERWIHLAEEYDRLADFDRALTLRKQEPRL